MEPADAAATCTALTEPAIVATKVSASRTMTTPQGRLSVRRVPHASLGAKRTPGTSRSTPAQRTLRARLLPKLVAAVQNGVVLTPLMALTVHTLPNKAYAFDSIAPHSSFGIGRAFAVLVAVFTVMLALTILGGHLRASWRRKRGDGRP